MIRSSKCLTQLKSIFDMKMIKCIEQREREKRNIEKKAHRPFSSVLITNSDKERMNRKVHMLPTTNYHHINSFLSFFLLIFIKKTAYLPEENWPIKRFPIL